MSPSTRFVPAAELGVDRLAALFNRGYEGYFVPVQLEPATFATMTAAWDIDLARARVAFADGEPVAFALLGVRGDRGWIGAMGVVPEWRGHGLGRLGMEAALAEARASGLRQVGLEVIQANTWASRIYEGLGFRDTRLLDVWTRPAGAPSRPRPALSAAAVPVGEALAAHGALHPEPAPWQRDLPSLAHHGPQLRAWGVRGKDGLDAMAIVHPSSRGVSILAFAARPGAGAGVLEAVLGAAEDAHPGAAISLANLPAGDAAGPVLAAAGFTVRLQQREMRLAF